MKFTAELSVLNYYKQDNYRTTEAHLHDLSSASGQREAVLALSCRQTTTVTRRFREVGSHITANK